MSGGDHDASGEQAVAIRVPAPSIPVPPAPLVVPPEVQALAEESGVAPYFPALLQLLPQTFPTLLNLDLLDAFLDTSIPTQNALRWSDLLLLRPTGESGPLGSGGKPPEPPADSMLRVAPGTRCSS